MKVNHLAVSTRGRAQEHDSACYDVGVGLSWHEPQKRRDKMQLDDVTINFV